jgi:parvulin-like peptidyl-prolyl isomerase
MSFRSRPFLDRKHRPRWQDELRTQQLVVAGFAVAIAIALGIFAATAWSSYYDNHLREVAVVGGVSFTADQFATREAAIAAELNATGAELQASSGGARDTIVQQQLQVIAQELQNNLVADTSDSLVTGAVMEQEGKKLGISVPASELDTEVNSRLTLPLRIQMSLITVAALPADSTASTPTDAQMADALTKANAIMADLKGGANFATEAKNKSDDTATKDLGGLMGWVKDKDAVYGDYFTAAKDKKAGDLIGPLKRPTGYAIVKVDAVRASGPNTLLKNLLSASSVSMADYRAYVNDDLLKTKFQDYFGTTVLAKYVPQRHVAEILLAPDTNGIPIPQQRVRHILVQPIPGATDQSTATQAQWDAALKKAEAIRAELLKPGADWSVIAKQSDDTGTANQGGDLGWVDPTNSGFVPEFQSAINRLKVGEISEPVKSQYGYHIIQVTMTRVSAQQETDDVEAALKKDPSQWDQLVKVHSLDYSTRDTGGDQGWIAPYQKDATLEKAIFALTKVGEISPPITDSGGIYIFKLLDTSNARYLDDTTRTNIQNTGFDTWVSQLKSDLNTWVDPQYQATSSSTTG